MVRLGQNFLSDPNLLAAIVRDAALRPDDVVLEVGGGEGALSAELASAARHVHVIELDERLRSPLEELAAAHGSVELHFADTMRFELGSLDPRPSAMVANLPYAVATPVLLRTVEQLPSLEAWTVMVQREIAERLRAAPGSRLYGAPSALVQLACDVRILRRVDRAVFTPRPRVDSAILRLERIGPAASPELRRLVHDAFAHRRKALARSLELARPGSRSATRDALAALGFALDARAEQLAPGDFARLGERLGC